MLDETLARIANDPALPGRFASFYDPLQPSYLYRSSDLLIHYRVTPADEDVAAMLRLALDLQPRGDPRRARLLARRSLALIWVLELDEAARVCLEASELIAASEGRANAAQYLTSAVTAMNDAGGATAALKLTKKGLELLGCRRDSTWAVLKSFDILRREAEDPAHLGIALDTEERREVAAVLTAAYKSGDWWPVQWSRRRPGRRRARVPRPRIDRFPSGY